MFLVASDEPPRGGIFGAAKSRLCNIVQTCGIDECAAQAAALRPPPRLNKPGTRAWEP